MITHAEPEKSLICAIIDQALYDYRILRDTNVKKKRDNASSYSTLEIEKFFNGNWCTELIGFLDVKLTGKDIIHRLKNENLTQLRGCLNCQRYS